MWSHQMETQLKSRVQMKFLSNWNENLINKEFLSCRKDQSYTVTLKTENVIWNFW